jgi:hypothetical protein
MDINWDLVYATIAIVMRLVVLSLKHMLDEPQGIGILAIVSIFQMGKSCRNNANL